MSAGTGADPLEGGCTSHLTVLLPDLGRQGAGDGGGAATRIPRWPAGDGPGALPEPAAPSGVATERDPAPRAGTAGAQGVARVFEELSTVDVLIHHRDIGQQRRGFTLLSWRSARPGPAAGSTPTPSGPGSPRLRG